MSCHFVDEHFDTGDLVEVERFPIDHDAETAFSLDLKSQEHLLGAVRARAGARARRRGAAARAPGRGPLRVAGGVRGAAGGASRATTARASCARSGTRPGPGAVIEVDGRRLTLVDDALLAEVARAYRDAGLLP